MISLNWPLLRDQIASVTHDTIELHVARPPRTRDDALALAYEQYAYCPDIVDQRAVTLDALAAGLVNPFGRIRSAKKRASLRSISTSPQSSDQVPQSASIATNQPPDFNTRTASEQTCCGSIETGKT